MTKFYCLGNSIDHKIQVTVIFRESSATYSSRKSSTVTCSMIILTIIVNNSWAMIFPEIEKNDNSRPSYKSSYYGPKIFKSEHFIWQVDMSKSEGFGKVETWIVSAPDKPVDKIEFISILIPSNSSVFSGKSNLQLKRTHKKSIKTIYWLK